MTRKRIARWPALPPRGLRPKLAGDQVRDLCICHLQNLDAVAKGDATEATLWQIAGAAFTWSEVASRLQVGVPEMAEQLALVDALIERYGRTGRVIFTGTEYQLAKQGVEVMDQLAEIVDKPTAVIAAELSERRINQLEAACRQRQAA